MELIIVVVVIGILAMIGLPQFFKVAERGRSAEAAAILGALRSAQLRYYAEYSAVATDCTKLDLETGSLKYFNAASCTGAAKNGLLGSMQRNDATNNYTIKIYDSTTGLCCSGTGCPAGYTACP
jgi:Tfp pilus assembly protein PilE